MTVRAAGGRGKMRTLSRTFIDTNILLYAVDRGASKKRQKARALIRELLRSNSGVISTQVLQEFYVIGTKKLAIDPLACRRVIDTFSRFELVQIDLELILSAIDCSILSKISFWDALVIVSARASGCRELCSEDLSDRQIIQGVRVVDPFQ